MKWKNLSLFAFHPFDSTHFFCILFCPNSIMCDFQLKIKMFCRYSQKLFLVYVFECGLFLWYTYFFSTIFFIYFHKKNWKTLNKMNISEWHEIVSNNVKKYLFLQERDPTKELSICRIIVNEKTLPFGRGSQELDDEETISGLLINWADWNTFVSNFYIIFIYFRKHQFTYKQLIDIWKTYFRTNLRQIISLIEIHCRESVQLEVFSIEPIVCM